MMRTSHKGKNRQPPEQAGRGETVYGDGRVAMATGNWPGRETALESLEGTALESLEGTVMLTP